MASPASNRASIPIECWLGPPENFHTSVFQDKSGLMSSVPPFRFETMFRVAPSTIMRLRARKPRAGENAPTTRLVSPRFPPRCHLYARARRFHLIDPVGGAFVYLLQKRRVCGPPVVLPQSPLPSSCSPLGIPPSAYHTSALLRPKWQVSLLNSELSSLSAGRWHRIFHSHPYPVQQRPPTSD